jgi:N-acetylmuramoyl-L-alanine amidase
MCVMTYAKSLTVVLALSVAGCAAAPTAPGAAPQPEPAIPVPGTTAAQRTPALPPIPAVDGPLRLEVGYPPEGGTITARDSNFVFGSTGSGQAELFINDVRVPVAPNGGFLAFLPVPQDGVYRLRATRNGETASLERTVRVPAAVARGPMAQIVSPYPQGTWAVTRGEAVEVGFRGPPGGRAALVLPDGRRIPLAEQGAAIEAVPGEQFRTDAPAPAREQRLVRYSGILPAATPLIARDTAVARPRIGTTAPPTAAATTAQMQAVRTSDAVLELVVGTDTVRTPLRFSMALLDAERPRAGLAQPPQGAAHDWTVRGRLDITGPFHYFWPPGTRFTITGERDNMYRVQLAPNRSAWVPAGDVRMLDEGLAPAVAAIGSIRYTPQPEWVDLRIPLAERLPFQVLQDEHTLHIDVFGATSQINFFQHGAVDPLVGHAEWRQLADRVFRVSTRLTEPVWGYHTFFDQAGALVLRIRRPPRIDTAAPLRNLLIVVDPGHGGEDRATRGPTGLTEADANLFISQRLRAQLQALGARVVMTRETDRTVPLAERPRMAADSGAHILYSVHNNAFPDGVNPWVNAGTSMYYYHPHSADLARLLQHEMLEELGLRDIGYGRADLALVRPTWMPSVLSETMFMMIPEQEAALRDPAVQERIAAAHVRALQRFLLQRAAHQR